MHTGNDGCGSGSGSLQFQGDYARKSFYLYRGRRLRRTWVCVAGGGIGCRGGGDIQTGHGIGGEECVGDTGGRYPIRHGIYLCGLVWASGGETEGDWHHWYKRENHYHLLGQIYFGTCGVKGGTGRNH